MADIADTRAQKIKLSNSRKKFKELQELKKKRNISEKHQSLDVLTNEHSNVNQTPAESLTSSTHSSVNDHVGENLSPNNSRNIENQLPNYFTKSDYGSIEHPVMFFDNLSSETVGVSTDQNAHVFDYLNSSSPQTTYLQNMISNVVETPKAEVTLVPDYSLFSQQNQPSFLAETQQILHPHQDSLSIDDPEISGNEILNVSRQAENHAQNSTDLRPSEASELQNSLSSLKSEPVFTNTINCDISHSSIENLQQLSNQMAQAIEPEFSQYSNSITDLEKRNLELASLLEQEKLRSEQQKVLLQELQLKMSQLQCERKLQDEQSQLQLSSEMSKLKEELQCHIQTVGLLVAEKTELSATLSQLELTCKQKNNECEELQARLKASRSRVADLEQEVNTFKTEKSRNVNFEKEHSEALLKAKMECNDLRDQKEELVQNLLEVREKLKNVMETNLSLQQQLHDNSSKLSMAELKIQQISNSEQFASGGQVETLIQEKFDLEKQISNLNTMLKTITKERDESSVQYQQYAQQLNAQITNFSAAIEHLQRENENFAIQDQNRVKHISELERQLQNLQNEQVTFATNRISVDSSLKNELENTRELCIQLQMEKTTAEENYTKTLNEKEMLMKELAAKNDSLSQLETMIEQLRGNQPDSVKLLATMESDKIAAARAVQQNKHLKEEMESMQEVFLKLDNDKVELTEKLTSEQSDKKDLLDKLQKVELHVQRLTDAIEIKDCELSSLRKNTEELNKRVLQDEQLADRLRHYEAHDHSLHVLQFQLQEAKQTIVRLTNEINNLKNQTKQSENVNSDAENGKIEEDYSKIAPQDSTFEKPRGIDSDNNNLFDGSSYECSSMDRESAMKCLEEKFTRTMEEIANLTEEKLRLEHLVLQLQGETETIGEYVALYQHQRMVLKQKAIEKDQQLKQLANDREQMKTKLEKLNELIKRLVVEKGRVPPELLQDHKRLTSQSEHFCEEHSKLHQEMNKICDGDSSEVPSDEKSETAEKIIELLSEIKNSNLVQSAEDVHHCAWCSGKLITV